MLTEKKCRPQRPERHGEDKKEGSRQKAGKGEWIILEGVNSFV